MRRVYSPGKFQPDVDGEQIRKEAHTAAITGQDLSAACPYPFWSEAGQHFTHLYQKARWAGVAGDNPNNQAELKGQP